MKESMKLEEKSISSKTTLSTGNLKKMLSLSKCCLSTSSVNIKNVETTLKRTSETKEEQSKNPITEHQKDELNKSVHSTSMVHAHSYLDKKLQHEVSEKKHDKKWPISREKRDFHMCKHASPVDRLIQNYSRESPPNFINIYSVRKIIRNRAIVE